MPLRYPTPANTPTGNVTHIERFDNVTYCGKRADLAYPRHSERLEPCARCTHNYKLDVNRQARELRRFGFDV